jgi:hypothetical protein
MTNNRDKSSKKTKKIKKQKKKQAEAKPDKRQSPLVISAGSGKKYAVKDNGKMDTGAPTKYSPDICQRMKGFFDRQAYWYKRVPVDIGIEKEVEVANDIPYFSEFARMVDVSIETFNQWIKEYPEFSEAYRACKEKQKEILCTNALRGNYNSKFAMFWAVNCTDMKENLDTPQNITVNVKNVSDDGKWKKNEKGVGVVVSVPAAAGAEGTDNDGVRYAEP